MNTDTFLARIVETFNDVAVTFIEYSPRILGALFILVIGWLLARLARSLMVKLISNLDMFWQRLVSNIGIAVIPSRRPPARFISELLFWMMILLSVVMATEVLGLNMFVSWLSEIVSYLPLLVSGLLIVLAGFVVSSLVRDMIASAMTTAGMTQGDVVGRLAQTVILFTSIVIGVDQVGIDVSFLTIITAIVLTATLGSVALAFGLGARAYVANLIAAHYLRADIRIGDNIQIDGIVGEVVEISNTRVVLDTQEGMVSLPASIIDAKAYSINKPE